ncbi:hypothetical protein ACH518_01665 [Methylomonas sp. HW2-6]|uniref:hypothetical protein n=1 Tax=Methylomonas sp. HW2-6 TaxID=3376687 RepID=UPI004040EA8C
MQISYPADLSARQPSNFSLPKKSHQKKGHPAFRANPALLAFAEGFRKGIPVPPKTLGKSCDARSGITGLKTFQIQRKVRKMWSMHRIHLPTIKIYFARQLLKVKKLNRTG